MKNPEGLVELPLQLPKCKHAFGETCLKKWLEEKNTCPYCRDELPPDPRRDHHRFRRAFAESSRTHGDPRLRHGTHSLNRSAMRHGLHMGRQSTESTEQNSEAQQPRVDRWAELEELGRLVTQRRVAIQNTERTADTHSASFSTQTSSTGPQHATSYHNQNSPTSRRARGRANSSRESGPGGESHQNGSGRPTTTLQSPVTMSTQQIPLHTSISSGSYALGQDSVNAFSTGHISSARAGAYNGNARSPTNPTSFMSYVQTQSQTQAQVQALAQAQAQALLNSNFGYRDTSRQDGNNTPLRGYPSNYGHIIHDSASNISPMMHMGPNHTVDGSRGWDNPDLEPLRTFPSASQFQPQFRQEASQALGADHAESARVYSEFSNGQGVASQDETSDLDSPWRQSHANEVLYSPSDGIEPSRDPHILANLPASSQVEFTQEQNSSGFGSSPPVAYSEDSRILLPLPPAHSNSEAEYQTPRNESTVRAVDGDYYSSTTTFRW